METGTAGHLLIYLVQDPESFSHRGILASGDRCTGIGINGNDWAELFFEILNCPQPPPYSGDPSAYEEQRSEEFRRSLPNNPMLARIYDMLADAWYKPEEVAALRAECIQIRDEQSAPDTPEALRTLIFACDEALKERTGLYLACD